jgi:hypothetical protein
MPCYVWYWDVFVATQSSEIYIYIYVILDAFHTYTLFIVSKDVWGSMVIFECKKGREVLNVYDQKPESPVSTLQPTATQYENYT